MTKNLKERIAKLEGAKAEMLKVGRQVGKLPKENRPVLARAGTGEFVSVVDGVTFGIMEGKPFHSARRDWSAEDRRNWALSNAIFFETLGRNLRAYAEAIAEGAGQ